MRFYLIFTRHHWRSWLVRGSVILGGYGGAIALYLVAALAGATTARQVLGALGLPLALAAAVYTAYLFAQAKARDMWQSPLLAPHLAVQAALAGAAAMLPLLAWLAPGRPVTADEIILAVAAAAHLALVAGRDHAAARHRPRPPRGPRADTGQAPTPVRPGNALDHGGGRGTLDRDPGHPARAGRAARLRARLRAGRPVRPARLALLT